jgi:hypothetical protein
LFDSLFHRPTEAHEKGSVEHLVGYARRNTLVPVPDFATWEELNAHLLGWCERERERLAADWVKERAALRSLPTRPYRACLTCLAPVSSLGLVTVDRNRYSVPCEHVGRTLRLSVFTDRIEVCNGKAVVASHTRSYQRGQTILSFEHYLPVVARKPHAASHAAFVSQMPAIYAAVRDELCHARRDGYREFARILLLNREFPKEAVTAALEVAQARGCLQATAVRQIILNARAPESPAPIAVPRDLAVGRLREPDLTQYDALLREPSRSSVAVEVSA